MACYNNTCIGNRHFVMEGVSLAYFSHHVCRVSGHAQPEALMAVIQVTSKRIQLAERTQLAGVPYTRLTAVGQCNKEMKTKTKR